MIIDISCYPTDQVDLAWWHDGEPYSTERLLQTMDGPYWVNGKPRRIDKAFVQPPQGNTIYTWTDGDLSGSESIDKYHAYVLKAVQQHPDRLIGCYVYNPRCGVKAAVEGMERYVKRHGFRMVQMQANMHAYRPDRALDWVRPALAKAAELKVPVKLHTGDGPYSIPTEWVPMIKEFPQVDFIMAHFGVQTGGVYVFEPYQWAMELPNVYCESGWCLQSRIVEFAKTLPKHKIIFGTDTPPNEPGMWLRLLEVLCTNPPQGLNLDETTLEDYFGNNIARMVGLEPTPAPKTFEEACALLGDKGRGLKPQPVIPLY
ncbi:MAG: amidohydrolase [Rubrivivax sp.]|nr:amidohydrolase [Rubrivivax sp.]